MYDSLCVAGGVGVGWQTYLEQHARQDQIARVSRATVAEVVGGGHATGLQAQEHTQTSPHIYVHVARGIYTGCMR